MNVLLVSAHPDDMEIGMGGTAAKLAQQGASLTSVVLTDGGGSANPFELSTESLVRLRQQEARKAAAILGIQDVLFCELPDVKSPQNFNTAREKVSAILSRIAPEEVYVLHPELDRHASHQIAGKIVLEALRGIQAKHTRIWAYEVWGLFHHWDRFEDISAVIGKKLQAIAEHRSQIACVPYTEGVMGLNRWRAVFADPKQDSTQASFAEVFLQLSGEGS